MYKSLEPYYQMTTMDENLNWIPKPNMDVNALNSAPFICRMRSPPPTQGGGEDMMVLKRRLHNANGCA